MKIKKLLKIIAIIIKYLLLILFTILLFTSIYVKDYFNDISFEQLLFTLKYPSGTSMSAISDGIVYVLIRVIIVLCIILLVKFLYSKLHLKVYLKWITKKRTGKINVIRWNKNIWFIVFLFVVPIASFNLLNLNEYWKNQKSSTKIFEDYYVDPKNISYSFPNKKRNLIYIFVESLESTNISTINGGLVEQSYIPNLENLALNNINFSNNDKIGGSLQLNGSGWTAGAMVSQTSGVPLKISIDANEYEGYGEFLPGVYNIGEVLKDNGYSNYLMMGSDATFGGRKDYFTYHSNYTIYDYVSAKEEGLIDKDYSVWWGYEDKKLFEFAKDKILKISKNDEPFNFTMLTADTHFIDGYLDESCPKMFESQYANSFYCSDMMINEFVEWIKKQDFYDNTTIIITGDHLTMQSGFYDISNGYIRTVYNTFINSAVEPVKEKERLFTSVDMYPTTLAALGVKIDGNKLGLGVNLFSSEQTLSEKLGFDYFYEELNKKSFFYDNDLLRNSYYQMQEKINEEKEG